MQQYTLLLVVIFAAVIVWKVRAFEIQPNAIVRTQSKSLLQMVRESSLFCKYILILFILFHFTLILIKREELPLMKQLTSTVKRTARLSPQALEEKSLKVAGIAFVAVVISLTLFNLISDQISATSVDIINNQLIFDLRNGYSSTEVAATLSNWGNLGRMLYLLIEFIDITLYHTGYRTLFVILLNNLIQLATKNNKQFDILKWLAIFPVILSFVDSFEDCGQILLTALYSYTDGTFVETRPDLWMSIVSVSSTINIIKWTMVRLGSATTACLVLLTAVNVLKDNVANNKKKNTE
jgi:hypothetical protein